MAVTEILRLRNSAAVGQRVTLSANGRIFGAWTGFELERDLANLSALATLEFYDPQRSRRAFPNGLYAPLDWEPLACGTRCTIAIDGEVVLSGAVEALKLRATGTEIAASVSIADNCADLVVCAAAPMGPVEYRNLTVLQFAERITSRFGIGARADVDVGGPFALLGIDIADTALAAIEKFARQRSLLVTSDGLGNLVLTRGGSTAAAAPLRLGEALIDLDYSDSWHGRFSDYYVKGQSAATRGSRLDSRAPTLTGPPPPVVAGPSRTERAAVVMTGHATDPEITRYRPFVRKTKSQSGGASVQEQADWMARVARGKGQQHRLRVLDFRAGPDRVLWRPNTRVLIDDAYSGVLEERLIGALTYSYGVGGESTTLTVVRPGAYDLDPAVRERHRTRRQGRAQDSTARPLTAS